MSSTTTRSRTMTALCAVMALVFLASVAVQFNDPDPLRWMAIYGLAAGVCLWGLRGPVPWLAAALVAVASLGWASTLAPKVLGQVRFGEMFASLQMHDARVEQGRELGGLLIVATFMAALLLWHRRR